MRIKLAIFRIFILSTIGPFLFARCSTKEGNNAIPSFNSESLLPKHVSSLVGEWNYNNSIYYSSEISFQPNGKFTFHDQGCYGQQFTQGTWIKVDESIILTSFDAFKPEGQTEGIETAIAKEIPETNVTGEIEDGQFSLIGANYSGPAPNLPGTEDTIRVYFDRVRLQLWNDTLKAVGANNPIEQAKFHRKQNN